MTPARDTRHAFSSLRPLVRYVDAEQAVIEVVFTVTQPETLEDDRVQMHVSLRGPDDRAYSQQAGIALLDGRGVMRFTMPQPQRWWPAGMGDQQLYEMTATLLIGDGPADAWTTTLGMTSVRTRSAELPRALLVNGRAFGVQTVVTVDRHDESSVLPVSGESLLLVRNHFGPDVLYDAADRAGILLVQSVPLNHDDEPDIQVRQHVDRLTAHPSLAGWYVGPQGRFADRIVDRLHDLDPTRNVFRALPVAENA